jgi:hypothetical protein
MGAKALFFKGENMDLPRNLYKSPGSITFNATKTYDTIVVNDKKEYDAGIEAGYIDDFADALNGVIAGEFEIIKESGITQNYTEVKLTGEEAKKPVIKKKPASKKKVAKKPDNFDDF